MRSFIKVIQYLLLPPLLVAMIVAAIYVPKHYQLGEFFNDLADGKELSWPKRAPAVDLTIAFQSAIKARDTERAGIELEKLRGRLNAEQLSLMNLALEAVVDSQQKAEAAAQQWQARQQSWQIETEKRRKIVDQQSRELDEAKKEIASIQSESTRQLSEFRNSLTSLNEAARQAESRYEVSANELARLRQTIENQGITVLDTGNLPFPSIELPSGDSTLSIPAPMTVPFKADSTGIPKSVTPYVNQMGEWLKQEPRLGIRLKGRLQSGFADEKNTALNRARSQLVRSVLLKNGASEEQIELAPPEVADSAEKDVSETYGLIELIFFDRN